MFSVAGPMVSGDARAGQVALLQALETVRSARQIHWGNDSPSRWQREFGRLAGQIEMLLIDHVMASEAVDSPLHGAGMASEAVGRQFAEHPLLIADAQHLLQTLERCRPEEPADVLGTVEETVLFEMRIAAHLNRLAWIVAADVPIRKPRRRARPSRLHGTGADIATAPLREGRSDGSTGASLPLAQRRTGAAHIRWALGGD